MWWSNSANAETTLLMGVRMAEIELNIDHICYANKYIW